MSIYVREGKVLLPTHAVRSGDIITILEPISILDVAERDKVADLVAKALSAPLSHVDLIDPVAHERTQPLPRAVKARSWSAFAKPAKQWVLREEGRNLILVPTHHAYNYAFQEDVQPIRSWPSDADPARVARETVAGIL